MEDDTNKNVFEKVSALNAALSANSHIGAVGCGCGTHHGDTNSVARQNLFDLLTKLGLKSPPFPGYGHLAMESLSLMFRNVTFDEKALQLWGQVGSSGDEEK